jgi:hypothetical protein
MSAPFSGGNGSIVSNGLEVNSKNNKKPTVVNDIIPIVLALSGSLLSTEKL